MNQGFPDVKTGFRKGRGTRDQCGNIRWNIEKEGTYKKIENSRKTSTVSLTTLKHLTADHNELWKILKQMGIPDHLTCM